MKSHVMFSSLFIAAFLFSSLGGVINVETAAAGPVVPCDVKWNNKKNQVKDKHRRRYIGCLAGAVLGQEAPVDTAKRRAMGCKRLKFSGGRDRETSQACIDDENANRIRYLEFFDIQANCGLKTQSGCVLGHPTTDPRCGGPTQSSPVWQKI